ncbi:MAG: glycoside hydrolase family 3 N-terminal domain-containing protein [Bacteroidota bacterium]
MIFTATTSMITRSSVYHSIIRFALPVKNRRFSQKKIALGIVADTPQRSEEYERKARPDVLQGRQALEGGRERPNTTTPRNLIRLVYCIVFLSLVVTPARAQSVNPLQTKDAGAQQRWVDSVYNAMSLQEKIGQLFMTSVFSSQDTAHTNRIKRLIKNHHIGGVIFSKGGPIRQSRLTNAYQAMSKTPLLIAMDAEWGLAMRLDSTFAYPWNMTLGAIKDNSIIEKIGFSIGTHLKRQGVHINFAPDVDINTNPKNPIIGNRSFGEGRENVTDKAIAFTRGMQNAGVMACAKHFPGHGDTDKDSHKTLPTINFSKARIDSVELYPYKQLIKEDLASVMIAHLNVPSLEPRDGYPSSISRNIVTELLKEKMKFKGLIFTDALNMKGASNFTGPGDIDLQAFLAGNDVLLISGDIPKAVQKIEEAYNKRIITEARLAHSVKKILQAKYKAGLHRYKPIDTTNIIADLNTIEDKLLYENAIKNAITIVKNKKEILPVKTLEDKRIAYVSFGDDSGSHFLKALQKYTKVEHVKADLLNELLVKLAEYNLVIIGLHRSNANPWKPYKFTSQELVWLYEIARIKNVILDVFVKPYALLDLVSTENIEGIVVSYQNSKTAQEKSAEIIFGAIEAKGMLPVTSHRNFPLHTSVKTAALSRLQYGLPESVGVNSRKLKKIDSVVQIAMDSAMVPGAQLLVARKGKVIYHKAFGKPTYDTDRTVRLTDIYDVASLTKILASLPMVMKLEETGKIALQSKLREILPELRGTNKADLTVLGILSHYAKLKPWIPFYRKTLDTVSRQPSAKYYNKVASNTFGIKVTEDLYLRNDYKDSIFKRIIDTDLREHLEYRYSDLPFFIFKRYIEKTYKQPLDKLVWETIYKPIGANYTTYNPLEKFDKEVIIPSEEDTYYRYQTIHGYVHDMGAAMQGGVGGHAGLFTNANDIAKIMQMYLQKGFYGGKRYFKETTIDKFNTCYFCKSNNRRGVGFDKPQLGETGPTCGCVSMTSFGHSGFTGTYTWADPADELVYVFLSNRTYPTATNRKLITHGTRTIIQQLIYDAIEE